MNKYFKFNAVSYMKAVKQVCAEYGVDMFHHSITLVDIFNGVYTFKVQNQHGVIFAEVEI